MEKEQGLIIDWLNMPTYNTIMCLAVGAAFCSLAVMGKNIIAKEKIDPTGWSLNLGVLGTLLFFTGLHMTLTWPLAKYFPFDNIVFGEPSLAIGAILLAFSFLFWKDSATIKTLDNPISHISRIFRHFKFLFYGLGLALIAIGIAGVKYQLFAAPPEEPISGQFAEYPMVEAIFISGLWALTGLASLLVPSFFEKYAADIQPQLDTFTKVKYGLVYGLGFIFLLFGAFNYFTHIGLIVNTMK